MSSGRCVQISGVLDLCARSLTDYRCHVSAVAGERSVVDALSVFVSACFPAHMSIIFASVYDQLSVFGIRFIDVACVVVRPGWSDGVWSHNASVSYGA